MTHDIGTLKIINRKKAIEILGFVFCVFGFNLHALAQGCLWSNSSTGNRASSANSITTDLIGNVYNTGTFSGDTLLLGGSVLVNDSGGTKDVFLVKYDSTGNLIWAKNLYGKKDDYGNGVAVDAAGYIYVTGSFASPTFSVGGFTLVNSGGYDFYLAKYSAAGDVIWVRNAGGSLDDIGRSVTVDVAGNVYVTGGFSSASIAFGSNVLTNDSAGLSDVFVVKYDSSGNVIWAKRAGGTNYDDALGIVTDGYPNIFLTGYFYSMTMNIGTVTLTGDSLGTDDIYVTKFDTSGNVIWAKRAGGKGFDYATGITTTQNGKIYICGGYSSTSIVFGTDTLVNSGGFDFLVAQYDSSGNAQWAKSAAGNNYDRANSVTVDVHGNAFVAGYYNSVSLNFGTVNLVNASSATYDLFYAQYAPSGNLLWANRAGSTGNDEALTICDDHNGHLFAAGNFDSPALNLGCGSLTNSGSPSTVVYIEKFDDFNLNVFEPVQTASEVRLFPNPNNGKMTVEWKGNGYRNISVYNYLGQKVYGSDIFGNLNAMTFELGDLKDGLYYLALSGDGQSKNVCFLVQR